MSGGGRSGEAGEGAASAAGTVAMPLLGLGVWQIPEGAETERAVTWALEAGYRHIDTAQAYGNEASVGRALASAGVDRDELFVTTKFDPNARDPVAELERSLERLALERVDLYLVHWPKGGPERAWAGMEEAARRGLSGAIGVSNFSAGELERVVDGAAIAPAVNQVHFSPFAYRRELLEACRRAGVLLEAYSPLTHGKHLSDPVVGALAAELGRTPAQVLLRWAVERGIPVIPKSARRERIAENARIFDFSLTAEELGRLDRLDRTGGTSRAIEHDWWTVRGRIVQLGARVTKPLRDRLRR